MQTTGEVTARDRVREELSDIAELMDTVQTHESKQVMQETFADLLFGVRMELTAVASAMLQEERNDARLH